MDRQIWDRQPEETSKAYVAFCAYRDQSPGARTVKRAAQVVHSAEKTTRSRVSMMEHWSARHRWVERARAYDDELDRRQRAEIEAERGRARRRRLDLARMQLVIGGKRLEALLKEIEAKGAESLGLEISEAVKLIEAGAKQERLELGEADVRRVEHTGAEGEPIDFRTQTFYRHVVIGVPPGDDGDRDNGGRRGDGRELGRAAAVPLPPPRRRQPEELPPGRLGRSDT